MRLHFFRGISAGLCIAIGGSVYLACDNKYVGAVMFSVALLSICMLGLSLYTGKIGFIVKSHKRDDVIGLISTLFGNLAGCVLFGYLASIGVPKLVTAAQTICDVKLTQGFVQALIRGIFCGVLMYIAVWTYREKKTPLGIIVCLPVFILSGFEHSVADMFYLAISGYYTLDALAYIAIIVLGNSIGSIIIPITEKIAGVKDEQ